MRVKTKQDNPMRSEILAELTQLISKTHGPFSFGRRSANGKIMDITFEATFVYNNLNNERR